MHKCEHCNKSYTWPGDLKRHLRIKHGYKKKTEQGISGLKLKQTGGGDEKKMETSSGNKLKLRSEESIENRDELKQEHDMEETTDDTESIPLTNDVDASHKIFNHPFTCIISGPSRCGKTEWTLKLLKHRNEMITPNVEQIIWCYGSKGTIPRVKEVCGDNVIFVQNLPDIDDMDSSIPKLIVMDDLQSMATDGTVARIFAKESHHNNMSCIFIVQNAFGKQNDMRDASLNTMYRVIFPNPIDKLQLHILGRGFKPQHPSYFADCLEDEKKETDYAYLLVDYTPKTKDILRVRTRIFPGEENLVYIDRDKYN